MDGDGEDGVDRISDLPDPVLEHILSFLPTLDAVRTTILAPRFHNLWTSVHALDFDENIFIRSKKQCFYWFVNQVLKLHSGSVLDKFVLSYFSDGEIMMSDWEDRPHSVEMDWTAIREIDGWVRWALSRNVKVLHLSQDEFGDYNYHKHGPPDCVWCNPALVELQLSYFLLTREMVATTHMDSLTTLRLEYCLIDREIVKLMICGCPLLEDLSIVQCDLDELSFDAPNIHKLKLVEEDNTNTGTIIIRCPNLSSFDYEGHSHLMLVDMSSLRNAALNIEFGMYRFQDFVEEFHQFHHLLGKTRHIINLSLSEELVGMFSYVMVKNIPYPFNCWKRVVLNMGATDGLIIGVFGMLRNSPYLEELTLNLSRRLSYRHEMIDRMLSDSKILGFSDWNSQVHGYICLRQHLKHVTIIGYGKDTSALVLHFAEILIKNASVLDKLVIKGETEKREKDMLSYEDLFKFAQTLLAIPRASTRATILIS